MTGKVYQIRDLFRHEDTFDIDGKASESVMYTWNSDSSSWDLDKKTEFTYNDNGNKEQTYTLLWNEDTQLWDSSTIEMFYFSDLIITGIEEVKDELSILYPNPVTDYLNIKLIENISKVTFELYDLQGHVIKTKEVENGERINLEHLNTGMYLYKIHADGKKQNGILMKR